MRMRHETHPHLAKRVTPRTPNRCDSCSRTTRSGNCTASSGTRGLARRTWRARGSRRARRPFFNVCV